MAGMTRAERAERAEALRQAYRDGYTDSKSDAVGVLRVSERQVGRLIKAGYLKSRKIGARVLVHHRSLLEYAGLG